MGRCFPDERVAGNEGAKFWLSVMNEQRNPIVGKTISQIVF